MAHGSANAIVTGITTTNDDDVLAFSIDIIAVLEVGLQERRGIQLNMWD